MRPVSPAASVSGDSKIRAPLGLIKSIIPTRIRCTTCAIATSSALPKRNSFSAVRCGKYSIGGMGLEPNGSQRTSMTPDEPLAQNHPLAIRMAAISFFVHNLVIGCIFGSYGVLLLAVEARTHLTRDLSSLGISLVLAVIALMAPVFGVLVGKFSLRLLMMLGALMMTAGFIILAV